MRAGVVLLAGAITAGCAMTGPDPSEGAHYGSWQGTLPCADCAGIETRLTLFRDPDRYRLSQTYVGKPESNNPVVQRGDWHLQPPESAISLGVIALDHAKAENRRQFQRQPSGALTLLDPQGQPIQSALNYTLQRRNRSDALE